MGEPERKKTPTWAIVVGILAAVGLLGIVVIGIMAALAVNGTKKYLAAAKGAEARNATGQLARGIVTCVENDLEGGKSLPPTAAPVPATLAEVAGKKYMSAGTDWDAPAYKCARFSMPMPQYYRYQWVRTSATEGSVLADADLDGDGKVDDAVSVQVTCTPGTGALTCRVGMPVVGGIKTAPP